MLSIACAQGLIAVCTWSGSVLLTDRGGTLARFDTHEPARAFCFGLGTVDRATTELCLAIATLSGRVTVYHGLPTASSLVPCSITAVAAGDAPAPGCREALRARGEMERLQAALGAGAAEENAAVRDCAALDEDLAEEYLRQLALQQGTDGGARP